MAPAVKILNEWRTRLGGHLTKPPRLMHKHSAPLYFFRSYNKVCRHAGWRGRWQHAALSYQGHIYIVGGWTEGHGCLSDTWRSSDGIRWQ